MATNREKQRKRRQQVLIAKLVIFLVLMVALVGILFFILHKEDKSADTSVEETAAAEETQDAALAGEEDTSDAAEEEETAQAEETTTGSATDDVIAQANKMVQQYDYDGATELLQSVEGYESNADIITLLADIETQKSTLVATSPENVTHIFYHSLVVDPSRGFSLTGDSAWDTATAGFCQWMTTVDEFNAITQQMYDRGYVLVALTDMIDITTDENGVEHVTAKDIYLPEGKTPFVLSLDDLSYYHSYNGRGTATRMIVGEDGRPTCEYVTAEGETLVGDYDCVPLMDKFIDEHPDFSYKGAKGTIALTGYDGILGYRTDYCYRDRVDLSADQEAYLEANPDFDWNAEVASATAVADALKNDGWTFASHTWGHIRVGDADMTWIQEDTSKWLEQVAPLVGGTNCIIFAHGQDLANWNEEYSSTEKFQYLKSQGFTIYCNVDSSQYFVQIGDEYLRMGRRNLDGYRLWMAVYGGDDRVSDLIDAASVIDPQRPTDASLYDLG